MDGRITTVGSSITTLESNIQSVNTTLNSSINAVSSDVSSLSNVTDPTINTLDSSGTIALSDNSINTITPSGAITFTLPTITDNTKFHQILVQINFTAVYSIDVGTTYFFNKKSPDLSAMGIYNLLYEYDKQNTVWVCGLMKKGSAQ